MPGPGDETYVRGQAFVQERHRLPGIDAPLFDLECGGVDLALERLLHGACTEPGGFLALLVELPVEGFDRLPRVALNVAVRHTVGAHHNLRQVVYMDEPGVVQEIAA